MIDGGNQNAILPKPASWMGGGGRVTKKTEVRKGPAISILKRFASRDWNCVLPRQRLNHPV